MSITINIKYHGKGDAAVKFIEEMVESGIVNEIRNKKGNLRYEYYLPYPHENYVLLIDEWEDQESLDLHHQSATMGKIAKLRDKYDLKMEVTRYTKIENEINDEKYIRK